MSLDVYLTSKTPVAKRGSGIFIRESGRNVEISAEEWNRRNPDKAVALEEAEYQTNEVYSANITHNLGEMASSAGFYRELWRPEEVGIVFARQMIPELREGLRVLEEFPERFKAMNPKNGWGNYEGLCRFVRDYLAACETYPDAEVSVSR